MYGLPAPRAAASPPEFSHSRTGFLVAVVGILVFCYRLINREEAELQMSQGEQYELYRRAVPRLLPSLWPRVASSGRQARWGAGFKAESWFWGFPLAMMVFAITLKIKLFFLILAASIGLLWASSLVLQKKSTAP